MKTLHSINKDTHIYKSTDNNSTKIMFLIIIYVYCSLSNDTLGSLNHHKVKSIKLLYMYLFSANSIS